MTTQHAGTITFYDPDTGQITRTVTGADVQRLARLVEIAEAIMREQEYLVLPRLRREWREAQNAAR